MNDLTVVVRKPDQNAMMDAALSTLSLAESVFIDSQDTYEIVAGELAALKKRIKDVEELRRGLVDPFHAAVKNLNDTFRSPREIYEKAEALYKRAMLAWVAECERKEAEERARLEAAAAVERARLAAEAAEAAEAGDTERAENATMEAAMTIAPAVNMAPKAAGTSVAGRWKGRVTDKAALVAHVAANPQLLNLIDIADSALNTLIAATKGAMVLPGVENYFERSMRARAAS